MRKSLLRFSTRRTLAIGNRKNSIVSLDSEVFHNQVASKADRRISFSINEVTDERHADTVPLKHANDFEVEPPRDVKHVLAGKPSSFYSSPREIMPVIAEDNNPPVIKAEPTESMETIVIDCVVLLQQFNVLIGKC